MRRCTYCGAWYTDEALVCAIDQFPLADKYGAEIPNDRPIDAPGTLARRICQCILITAGGVALYWYLEFVQLALNSQSEFMRHLREIPYGGVMLAILPPASLCPVILPILFSHLLKQRFKALTDVLGSGLEGTHEGKRLKVVGSFMGRRVVCTLEAINPLFNYARYRLTTEIELSEEAPKNSGCINQAITPNTRRDRNRVWFRPVVGRFKSFSKEQVVYILNELTQACELVEQVKG